MIRIYGISDRLNPIKERLSDVINSCMVDARSFPEDKRAHRFIPLSSDDFFYTHGRTDQYTVIEINMMKGRTEEAKKRLIHLLFERMEQSFRYPLLMSKSPSRKVLPAIGDSGA